MNILSMVSRAAFLIAFIFYTLAVFRERKVGLKKHVVSFFVIGFILDSTATFAVYHTMSQYKKDASLYIHIAIGAVAIIIMGVHAFWALFSQNNENRKKNFHKYSLYAWFTWVFTLITGIFLVVLNR